MLDTTWHLWRTYSTHVRGVSARVNADAERFERDVYRAAAHCFSVSEYVARDLIDYYGVPPERVTAVGTGRGALQPYFGPKDYGNGSILFVAKDRFADKGGDRLLEAFRIARRSNSALTLTIVGREEYVAMFSGLEGVTPLGHIPFEQLQSLFNRASLFAMPAVLEPWGLVYLEALACRTPVLGLRDHALPEITGNGRFGFCLESAGADEIARALLDAFADPAALARMGSEGQAHTLATYTWEKTVWKIMDIIAGTR